MSWAADADKIAAVVAAADPGARVILGERMLRQDRDLLDLFGVAREGLTQQELRGWIVTREAIEEEPYTQAETVAIETYKLRLIGGFSEARDTEVEHQGRVDEVLAAVASARTIGDAFVWSSGLAQDLEIGQVGPFTCHLASILVELQEVYTASSTGPATTNGVATGRDAYTDTAAQIAAELAGVTGAGRVHSRRRYAVTDEDHIDQWTVQSESGSVHTRDLRGWQLWRSGVTQTRGIGGLTEAVDAWALQGFWGWLDHGNSYDAFQRHLDDVRARFRARAALGNPSNASLAISGPLQVQGITGRRVGDYAAHFADCQLATEVGTYAAF